MQIAGPITTVRGKRAGIFELLINHDIQTLEAVGVTLLQEITRTAQIRRFFGAHGALTYGSRRSWSVDVCVVRARGTPEESFYQQENNETNKRHQQHDNIEVKRISPNQRATFPGA